MGPSVEVEWIDSGTMLATEGWTEGQAILERAKVGPVITRGTLLQMTPDVAVVGLSYDPEHDQWFGVQVIDRRTIEKIRIHRIRRELTPEMFDELL